MIFPPEFKHREWKLSITKESTVKYVRFDWAAWIGASFEYKSTSLSWDVFETVWIVYVLVMYSQLEKTNRV